MKQITTNFNDYKAILEADVVTVHTLVNYFKKDQIDFDEHGNVFIGFNDKTAGLPILVAHTDNVLHGKRIPVFDLNKRILSGKQAGIGFDDKAGIIAIIQLWKTFSKEQMFRIIFTAQEEVGGLGAQAMDEDRYLDAPWMIELDRKNHKDLIQTSGGTRLCSDEFAAKWEELGFEKAQGVYTDVNEFKERANWINMANLSIAYYNPHTDDEYLDTKQFDEIVNKVATFIEQKYVFEDDKPDEKPTYNSGWWNNNSDRWSADDNPMGWDYCWNCGKMTKRKPNANGEVFCGDDCERDYEDFVVKSNNKGK